MIKELFVLTRKKIFKYLILLIIFCLGLSLTQLKPSSDYDNFYDAYSNQLELFDKDESYQLIPVSNEGEYIYYQLKYLVNRRNKIIMNVDMLERKIESSLFKDDLDELKLELTFEKEKENEEVKFYNTYLNEKILSNNLLIYCLYIMGISLAISIFYDDVKNGQSQIFKTYKNNLKNIFKSKLFSYMFLISICTLAFMFIELILLDGNYSVYNLKSFSETFMNLNLIEFIVLKYLNAFINTILVSTMFMSVLFATRNLVVTMISSFLGMLMSFFAFATTMSNFKYFNLYYLLFVDKLQFNGVNTLLSISKIILCVGFVSLFYLIYLKDFNFDFFKNRKKAGLKSTNVILHILRELLFQSKGILAITIVLLFSVYQVNTFKISSDFKETSYQQYKTNYLGTISNSKYEEILYEYQVVQENYSKFLEIEEIANQNPEQSIQIYRENEDIISKAQNMDNIQRLKAEYEEAMELGLSNFVDNRGSNILLMKDQPIYLLECLSILVVPLVFIYISFRKQMTIPSYSNIIKTSKLGVKNYFNLSDILFVNLTVLNTLIMVVGHIIKVKKYYLLDFSYSLKDILYANSNLSILSAIILFSIIVIFGIIIISKILIYVMYYINSKKNK